MCDRRGLCCDLQLPHVVAAIGSRRRHAVETYREEAALALDREAELERRRARVVAAAIDRRVGWASPKARETDDRRGRELHGRHGRSSLPDRHVRPFVAATICRGVEELIP